MKKPGFSKKQIEFEHEIGYSQSIILFDILLGLAFLFGGVAFTYWVKWWGGAVVPLLGLFMMWQAVKRGFNQGPQLMIGRRGIWTANAGFLPWGRALSIIKTEAGYRSATTCLIVLNRTYPEREITRVSIRNLDVDGRTVQAYLNKYSPKQI